VSSGYSATFFAASKQRNSNSVQGIFMYEKFNRNVLLVTTLKTLPPPPLLTLGKSILTVPMK
jgi:hypothetical protein